MVSIRKLSMKSIGPFDIEDFEFQKSEDGTDIHIIVGPNGTGKTTILHSLAGAFDYFQPDHAEHVSNNIHKRFVKFNGKFSEDEKDFATSHSHTILVNDSGKIIDKIVNYGCTHCGNIHQNFEKTISQQITKSENGNNYQNQPQNKDLLYYKNAIKSKDLIGKKLKFAAFGYSGYRFIETEEVQIKEKENFNPLHLALEFVKRKDGSEKEFNLSNWIVSTYSKAAIQEVNNNKELASKLRHGINKLIDCINDLTDNEFSIKIETSPWFVNISYCGNNLEFDVLPDGLRSILSWLGDLLMRLDVIPWEDDTLLTTEQNILLFLDEIEVHLHPTWQYKILNMLKKLLPNAQIFITTHSPFIINSIDNAKIYVLELDNCKSKLKEVLNSETGWSIEYVLEYILNTKNRFGYETTVDLKRFNEIAQEISTKDFNKEDEFKQLIKKLVNDGEEVTSIIAPKLFRLEKVTGKKYLEWKE
ncbi:MAG: AAA family ATPase [Saprospiraceae bacterium]|nr:AAA family ATPase [Saprospiraceae bacterium]